MSDSCTCCCGSKKAEDKKPVDPKVEEAKELKKKLKLLKPALWKESDSPYFRSNF